MKYYIHIAATNKGAANQVTPEEARDLLIMSTIHNPLQVFARMEVGDAVHFKYPGESNEEILILVRL